MHAAFHRSRLVIVDTSTFVDPHPPPHHRACKRKRGANPPSEQHEAGDPAGSAIRLVPVAARASPAAAGLRPRLVDRQRPSAVFLAGQRLDGVARLGVVAELHEAEAFRAAGLAVRDDGDRVDASVLGEKIAEVILRRVVGEITNIELHRNEILSRRSLNRLTDAPLDGARPPRGSSDFVERETACGRRASTGRDEGYQLEPRKQASRSDSRQAEGRVRSPSARATNREVTCFRQKKEKSVLSIGRDGPAAAAAAASIDSRSSRRPSSTASADESRSGAEATPPRTRRAAATLSPSNQTAAPTESTGKSNAPRRRSFR